MPHPTERPALASGLAAIAALCAACSGNPALDNAPADGVSAAASTEGSTEPAAHMSFGDVGDPAGEARWGVRWIPSWRRGSVTGSVRVQRLASEGDAFGATLVGAPEDAGLLSTRKGLRVLTTTAGSLYATELSMGVDGTLTAKGSTEVRAGGVAAAQSIGASTPWGTFVTPDATESESAPSKPVDPATPVPTHAPTPAAAPPHAPYTDGWVREAGFTDAGVVNVTTQRAMGRFAHGGVLVLPDRRTVYMSESREGGGGLYLFIADAPGDLSAGHLYAADVRDDAGAGAELVWIPLGRVGPHDVDTALASTVRGFDDLFETSAPNGSMCTDPTITPVDVDGTSTCLKVKAGLESVATRLETHRVAASRGATMEWTGAAGLAFDPDHGRVYLALSSVGGTMSDGKGDIRDPGPNACGAVIAFGGLTSANDQFGALITSTFAATRVDAFVAGAPTGKPGAQACDPTKPANPAGLAYIRGQGQVLIGEATSQHAAPTLWAWDADGAKGVRIATGPMCGAWAGLHWVPDLAGSAWLTFTYRNAFACPPEVPLATDVIARLTLPDKDASKIDSRAYVGAVGPFRGLD